MKSQVCSIICKQLRVRSQLNFDKEGIEIQKMVLHVFVNLIESSHNDIV
jgi:hypothetical protein